MKYSWIHTLTIGLIVILSPDANAQCQFEPVRRIDGIDDGNFGRMVSAFGDTLVVGAPRVVGGRGIAFVYRKSPSGWDLVQELIPDRFDNAFGIAGDLDDRYVAVGAGHFYDTDFGPEYSDLVSMYRWVNGTLELDQRITPSRDFQSFGRSLDLCGDEIVIGAPGSLVIERGSAYVYRLTGDRWEPAQQIQAPTGQEDDRFGETVALSEDTLLVGAPLAQIDAKRSGVVYTYRRKGTEWVEAGTITVDEPVLEFGRSMALASDFLAIAGWPLDEQSMFNELFLYRRTGDSWQLHQILQPSDRGAPTEVFASSLDFNEDVLMVGSESGSGGFGSAYTFVRSGPFFYEQQKYVAPGSHSSHHFARDVALSDNHAYVGAPGIDAAYAFPRWDGLTLVADEEGIRGGDSLALESACGLPEGPLLLVLVSINREPVFQPIVMNTFGTDSWWHFEAMVPKELENNALGLVVLGLDPQHEFQVTNTVLIKVR